MLSLRRLFSHHAWMHKGAPHAGRVAIVTGGARGIGRAVCEELYRGGASIVCLDADRDGAERVADELGHARAIGRAVDVSKSAELEAAVGEAVQRFGGVHVLVNCAGVLRPTHAIDITDEEWRWIVDVNLTGTFLACRSVLHQMRAQKFGRIVNISSTAGKSKSTAGGPHYTASKAGVLGLTRHLAFEEAPHGITVNALCPGLFDTEMVRSTLDAQRIAGWVDSFPIKRLGRSDEVAALISFLCSDSAAYITGASMDINGGDLLV